MKRYAEYKDSGIEWIGEIPKDWIIKRIKFIVGGAYHATRIRRENENISNQLRKFISKIPTNGHGRRICYGKRKL